MKVHLMYPDIRLTGTDWPGYYYHGVGFLATSLKRKGHEVTMQHLVSFDEKVILEKI